jgi:hypothetical protein
VSEQDDEARAHFLAAVRQLQDWLGGQQIPFAIFGSVGVAAYIDRGSSLDFHRASAYDATQQIPDIDLLVPRSALDRVQARAAQLRDETFPVRVDTVGSQVYIDLRPDEPYSYLTHRKINFPVRSTLFAPQSADLLGTQIQTLDPYTLLHTLLGTIGGGALRKKDVPKIEGLSAAIASGAARTRFTAHDMRVFEQYQALRREQYPVFVRSKQAWETLLGSLPPRLGNAVRHYVSPSAQRMMGKMNRTRDRDSLGR